MSGIRHDRSVIDAYGGVWSRVADKVRAESLGLATEPERDDARRGRLFRERRQALGLTQGQLAVLAGYAPNSKTVVVEIEGARGYPESLARIAAALTKAEAELLDAENTK